MADINVKLLQGTEAKMKGDQAPAIKDGQLYFATIDEGTKGYIYLDSNGKRFSFGKYAETAGYATEAGAAGIAEKAKEFSAATTVALTGDATGTSQASTKGWTVPVEVLQAAKLKTARKIDGISFNGESDINRYAVCSTQGDTVAKTASILSGTFNLVEGAKVTVKFTYANTVANPTLNINSTGAKQIYAGGSALSEGQWWKSGAIIDFVYNGEFWVLTSGAGSGGGAYWANIQTSHLSNENTKPTFNPEFKVYLPNNTVIPGTAGMAYASPIGKYLWHDLFAFGVNGYPTVSISSNGGSSWTTSTNTDYTHKPFIKKENQSITVLKDGQTAIRWQWFNSQFHACQAKFLNIGFTYQASIGTFNITFETSKDGTTWTKGFEKTGCKYNQAPYWFYLTSGWSSEYYARLTLTRTSSTGSVGISGIKLLTSRWGDQGRGSEYEYPYDWDIDQNIFPRNNNTAQLGTQALKWKDVYATTFHGALDGNATSATTASSAAKVNHTLSTNTKYSLSGTILTANGSSDIVFDTGIYTDTTPGHLVVTGGIDNTGDLKQADGHIYLTGAQPSSSTGNSTQIVFGTPSDQHIVLSSNKKLLVLNPTTSTTANQILFYLDQASKIPSGLQVGSAITPITTGQTSLGTTGLKFSSLHLSGDANIDGGASVGGNLTVTNKTILNGALEVIGASTFTGLITANGGVKGNVTGNLTGNADTATEADKAKKWSATKAFKVVDASGENAGTAVNVDGTADVTLKMPTKFKGNHTIDGNLIISGDTSTSGNVTLNGSGKTFTSNIDNKFVKQIKGNISAAHGYAQGGASGYHLISIVPTSSWMLAFTIRVYQAYTYTDIAISGYNYSSDKTWYSPKATIIGTNGTKSMDVVFGCSAANQLWLAIPANNYYGIDILNVTNGYTQITDYSNLFTLSVVATLPTSTPIAAKTITAYAPWYRGEIVSTENGGTGNNAFTANRLLYSESATKLSSSGHYSSANKVAINSTEIDEALTFYVSGNSKISGELNATGNVDFDNNLNVDRLITQGGPTSDTSIDAMNKFKTDLFVEGSGAAPNAPTIPGFYLGKSATDGNRHMDIVSGENVSYIDFNKASHARDFDFRIHANVSNGLVDFQWGDHSELTDKRLKINGLTEINSTHTTKNALKVTGGAQISNTLRIGVNGTNSNFDGNWCEGIRINADDGEWVTIALGTTGETNTNTHCWSIHRTNANKFAIAKNGAAGLNGLVLTSIANKDEAADGRMGLGTDTPTHRLHVIGDTKTEGTLYLERNKGVHAGKINFWRDTYYNWVEYMAPAGDGQCPTGGKTVGYGDVTTYARRSIIENISGYGWMWESSPVTTTKAASTTAPSVLMSLSSNTGKLKVKGIIETENNLSVAGTTTLNNTLTVTTGGAQITGNSKITGALEVTGRGSFAGLTSTAGNNFICSGNEFNFIPDNYSGVIYINYQTVSRNSTGAVSSYTFLTGNGTTTSYADLQAKNAIFSGNLTVKGNTVLGDANTDNTTIYGTLYKKGDSTNKGHIYLDGAASSSTNNTTQIIFREGTTEHIALSSNDDCFVINPTSTSSSPQIALYLGTNATSSIPGGLSLGKQLSVGTNATIGGTLQVTGTSTFTGKITANGGITGNVTGNVTGNAGGSAQTLANNSTANLSGCLQYFQSSTQTSGNDMPSAAWHHVIKMNHGTGDSYYKRLLAFDFFSNTIKTTYKNGESTDHTTRWVSLWKEGDSVTGAVWNDYAECRESDTEDFGYVLTEVGDDSLTKTTERLQHFAGVSSDTWGFSQGETEKAKTPIAVAGRVLVYPYQDRNNYKPGDCVCAAAGGTVDIMTREEIMYYPDRIVGTVSCVPEYEEWGGGEIADRPPVKVNGRIWIKVR